MGTETRIGIVAGLLIVVVASVYFFYGANRKEEDVLVAAGPKATGLKIPGATDGKAASMERSSPLSRQAAHPQRLSPSAAQSAPVRGSSPSGGMGPVEAAIKPNGGSTAPLGTAQGLVGPPAESVATGIDKYRVTVPYAPPEGVPVVGSTLLRTGAAPSLVEATKENLKSSDSGPSFPPVVSRVGEAKTAAPVDSPRASGLSDAPPDRVRLQLESKPTGSSESAAALQWPKKHLAAKGDTIASLAKLYYGDSRKTAEIIAANPKLKGKRAPKPGDEVTIPAPADVSQVLKDSSVPAAQLPSDGKSYIVQPGDTFYSIARTQLGDPKRAGELLKLNNETVHGDAKRLRPGMTIRLPQ